MKKALLASAACAALGLASMAQAAIVPTLTVVQPTLTNQPGWSGYKLTLTSSVGPISAVDFGGVDAAKPAEANKGILGVVAQRWTKGVDPDTGDPIRNPSPAANANTTTANTRDSFWNNVWGRTGVIYSENEDNDGVNQTGQPADDATFDYGAGHAMHFATGVAAASQAAALDVAYLVLPTGSTVAASGPLHVVGEVQETGLAGKTPVNFFVAVPEPASASLLGLGALGLVARRRRK